MSIDEKSEKIKFVQRIQGYISTLATHRDLLMFEWGRYYKRTWNSGGAKEIVNADIETLNRTATQVGDAITFIDNLDKFCKGQAHTTTNFDNTIKKFVELESVSIPGGTS